MGTTVEAHRHVIADVCELKMPTRAAMESGPIELPPPCNADAFNSLVEFCYTGQCTVAEYLIVPFMQTAHYCKASSAIKSACEAFRPHVSAANCLEVLFCAQELKLPASLTRAAEEWYAADARARELERG